MSDISSAAAAVSADVTSNNYTPPAPVGTTDWASVNTFNSITAGIGGINLQPYGFSNPPANFSGENGPGLPSGEPYSAGEEWFPPQRQGIIRSSPGILASVMNQTPNYYSCSFMYNPNDVQVSFSMNTGNVPPFSQIIADAGLGSNGQPTNTPPAGNSGYAPNLTTAQTCSFSLLFDRTYSMLYDPNPGNNRGVLWDIGALYSVLGAFETFEVIPQMVPVEVIFGITSGVGNNNPLQPTGAIWGFTGYMTQIDIDYGIFKSTMIPFRCEVDLQLMMVYMPLGTPVGSTNGNTSLANAASSVGNAFSGAPSAVATGQGNFQSKSQDIQP